jgi:hypothetical protein
MRLPGFTHNKGDPFTVQFNVAKGHPSYSVSQIVDGLGLQEALERSAPRHQSIDRAQACQTWMGNPQSLTDAEEILRFIEPWERERWRDVLFWLADQFGERGYELALRWSRGDLLTAQQKQGSNP